MNNLIWNESLAGYNGHRAYWRLNPDNITQYWHASFFDVGVLGHTSEHMSQRIETAGWYWYSINYVKQHETSGTIGPFMTAEGAMADCERANQPDQIR